MTLSTYPFITGFLLGGSLIVAIGAQNAFILRMGLLRQHVFWLCLFCAISDALLIIVGVAGLGYLVDQNEWLLKTITIAGALFLFSYAFFAFKRVLNPQSLKAADTKPVSLASAIAICASFTWLNPHVYLDTVVLVGGYSGQFASNDRIFFTAGAVLASFTWFFGLGYAARYLRHFFESARSWQILDVFIALVMAILGFSLIISMT